MTSTAYLIGLCTIVTIWGAYGWLRATDHLTPEKPAQESAYAAELKKPMPVTDAASLNAWLNPPSRDEFDTWKDDPVTAFVFAALRSMRNENELAWHEASWVKGAADQLTLTELRSRADAYEAMADSLYEDYCAALGIDPEPMEQADAA